MTVAFADLVGFTRLGEELPPAGLERVAARLTELAQSVTDAPVRLVKSIGDAVMLASPDARPARRGDAASLTARGRGGTGLPAAADRDRLRAGDDPRR